MSLSRFFFYYYEDEDENTVKRFTVNFDADGHLVFIAVGSNRLSKADEYHWTVTADGNEKEYISTGSKLVLSEDDTEDYLTADDISVKVVIDTKESGPFEFTISNFIVGVAIAGSAISA